MIATQSMANVRDLGGWPTQSGHPVRYGLLYRGTEMNGEHTASDADKQMLLDLGIRADLDLRTADEAQNLTASPLASVLEGDAAAEVDYLLNTVTEYSSGVKADPATYARAFQFLVAELRQDKPVYFHCIWGCDRTGTLAFLVEGMLGLSASDLCKEFELSTFSNWGTVRTKDNLTNLFTYIKGLEGETLQDKFQTFWTSVAGISLTDVHFLRNKLLGIPQGDIDYDGRLTLNDVRLLSAILLEKDSDLHGTADLDDDGTITIDDLTKLIEAIGK